MQVLVTAVGRGGLQRMRSREGSVVACRALAMPSLCSDGASSVDACFTSTDRHNESPPSELCWARCGRFALLRKLICALDIWPPSVEAASHGLVAIATPGAWPRVPWVAGALHAPSRAGGEVQTARNHAREGPGGGCVVGPAKSVRIGDWKKVDGGCQRGGQAGIRAIRGVPAPAASLWMPPPHRGVPSALNRDLARAIRTVLCRRNASRASGPSRA